MDIDPGRVRNWAAIVGTIVVAIIAISSWVARSEATDEKHTNDIEEVKEEVKVIKLSVEDITTILKNQEEERIRKSEIAEAKRQLMQKLCKDSTFRNRHDMECQMANVDG